MTRFVQLEHRRFSFVSRRPHLGKESVRPDNSIRSLAPKGARRRPLIGWLQATISVLKRLPAHRHIRDAARTAALVDPHVDFSISELRREQ